MDVTAAGPGLEAALDSAPTAARARVDLAAGTLVGGRCTECGAAAWPARAVCHRCGAAGVRPVPLRRHGTLVSCTRVLVPRPGLPTPYVLGQVVIDEGPVVFGQVRELADLDAVPCRVVVRVDPERYWFDADAVAAPSTDPPGLPRPSGHRHT